MKSETGFTILIKYFLICPAVLMLAGMTGCNQSKPHEEKLVVSLPQPAVNTTGTVLPDTLRKPPLQNPRKKIYLTFDDGPNDGSPNVISAIIEESIPASFFIIGVHTTYRGSEQKSWASLQQIPHIDICNHSYTHGLFNRFDKFYSKPDVVVSDFQRARDSLKLKNNFVRTPGRNSWRIGSIRYTDNKRSTAAIDSLYEAGFMVVGWDLEWQFNFRNLRLRSTADQLISQIDYLFKNGYLRTKDNLVILAHDQAYHHPEDYQQLKTFIQKIKARPEYEFALIRDYPAILNKTEPHQPSVVTH
jgi:peptidoglycan/xylan/chitin deacetylase (PgdA/CDA1 family)